MLRLLLILCLCFLAGTQLTLAAPIVPGSFSTTWDTGSDTDVTINLGVCPSSVYWEEIGNDINNGTSTICNNGEITVSFPSPGQYRTDFSGDFSTIDLGGSGFISTPEREKFRTVEQWGVSSWDDLYRAFGVVTDLAINAQDVPNLSEITDLSYMFYGATNFNSNINNWDVSSVTAMTALFSEAAAFNQPLNNWNVSNVAFMFAMFTSSSFNQDISSWDVSNVTDMTEMFAYTPFNQPIDSWDVSNVEYMNNMFYSATFNQPLNSWDVSNVIVMSGMFSGATAFNQPLDSWNVSNVVDMSLMFEGATAFNQPLNIWNVANVVVMQSMFLNATAFNQPLDSWNVSNVSSLFGIFSGSNLSETNYTKLLNSWSLLSLQPDQYLDTDAQYCGATAQAARDILTNAPNNWVISDGGATADCVLEEVMSNSRGGTATRVGNRVESYFYSSSTQSASSIPALVNVTKESFLQSVRNLIDYLAKNEDALENLTPEESTKIIVGLRDIITFLLRLIPGV